MNKILMVCFLLISTNVFANQFGARFGLNQTYADATPTNGDIDEELGFSFGIFYERAINSKLNLSVDLLYSAYNSSQTSLTIPSTGFILEETEIEYRYLTIRPTVTYRVLKNFDLIGGLTLETPLSAESKEETTTSNGSGGVNKTSQTNDVKSDSESLKISANIGIGYRFNFDSFTLIPRLMYQIGLNSAFDSNGSELEIDALMLDFGVLF